LFSLGAGLVYDTNNMTFATLPEYRLQKP
jgi:hypothetical protein